MKRKRLIKRVAAIVCILAVLFVIPVSAAGSRTFTINGDIATANAIYYTQEGTNIVNLLPYSPTINVVEKDVAGTPHDLRYLTFHPTIAASYFCVEYEIDLTVDPGEMFTLKFPVNVMSDSLFADVPDFSLSVYDEDLNGYTLTSSENAVILYPFLPAVDYMNVAQGEVSFSFRNDTSSALTRATFNLVCHDLYMQDGYDDKAISFGFYDYIKIAVEGGSVDVDGIKDSIDELGDQIDKGLGNLGNQISQGLENLGDQFDQSINDAIGDDSEFQGDSDRYNDKTDKGDEQNKGLEDQDAQKEEILNNAVADASAALENYNFFDLNRMIDGMSGLTASFNVVSNGFSSLLASLGTDFGSFMMYIIAGGVLLALLGEIASASIRGVRAGRQAKERERAKNKKE